MMSSKIEHIRKETIELSSQLIVQIFRKLISLAHIKY